MSIDRVLDVLRGAASRPYIGEPVSQLDHALQCAALAARAGADGATIAAALLHDVGHICAPAEAKEMPGLGVVDHERVGASFLRDVGFAEDVTWLVASHVAAKRYLVATKKDYASKLSAASTATLALQGGPMSAAEIAAFEREPRMKDALRLRAWDEQAKEIGWSGPGLDAYRDLLVQNMTPSAR